MSDIAAVSTSTQSPPAFLIGDFEDDYGARFTISAQEFFQRSRNHFHIVHWNVGEQYFIARNDSLNPSDANKWTRIDWLPLTGMEPFGWAFCFSAYKAATRAEAEGTTTAKRDIPKTGCNGFPFSRMKRSVSQVNPRFGQWLLKSDAPAPTSNIMTYEALGAKGMKVTIQAVNARGDTTRWWYTTAFDGKDMPVTGNAGQTHAAVKAVSEFVNEIVNKKDGKVTQRLTNVLSPDGQTIAVIYMRDDGTGKTTGVTFATYERIK